MLKTKHHLLSIKVLKNLVSMRVYYPMKIICLSHPKFYTIFQMFSDNFLYYKLYKVSFSNFLRFFFFTLKQILNLWAIDRIYVITLQSFLAMHNINWTNNYVLNTLTDNVFLSYYIFKYDVICSLKFMYIFGWFVAWSSTSTPLWHSYFPSHF